MTLLSVASVVHRFPLLLLEVITRVARRTTPIVPDGADEA